MIKSVWVCENQKNPSKLHEEFVVITETDDALSESFEASFLIHKIIWTMHV